MKLQNENIAQKIIAFVSLALVALILCNNAIYLHSHKLADGQIIVHAHPFDKSGTSSLPGESHKHSKTEFLFYDQLTLLFPILLLVYRLLKFEKKKIKLKFNLDSYSNTYRFRINGRSPPLLARFSFQ